MRTFYDWWTFFKEEDEAKKQDNPSHTMTLKDTLKVNPTALVGMTIPFTGILRDKRYNMVGLTILGFDDNDNPTRVRLSIFNNSPNMDSQVRFVGKDKDKEGEGESETQPDDGEIDISLEEFDEILGKGWEPAVQAAAAGGAGGGMGGPGGPLGGM